MVRAELTFKQFSVMANKSLFASAWLSFCRLSRTKLGQFFTR
jgi:hypothetical protein